MPAFRNTLILSLTFATFLMLADTSCRSQRLKAGNTPPKLAQVLKSAQEIRVYRRGSLGVWESKPFLRVNSQHSKNIINSIKASHPIYSGKLQALPDLELIVVDQDKSEHGLAYVSGTVASGDEVAVLDPVAENWLATLVKVQAHHAHRP